MRSERARSTRDEWRARVRGWKASGLTAQAFAAREGISAATLSWWRWRLSRDGERVGKARTGAAPRISRARFVEITGARGRAGGVIGDSQRGAIRIELAGAAVVVGADVDAEVLGRVLAAVERRA